MTTVADLPANVRVSSHPCLQAKLSQLRSAKASARDVKALIHEISTILGCEALASAIVSAPGPKEKTPLGFEYTTTDIHPKTMSLVPILRSGLGMVDGMLFSPPHRPHALPHPSHSPRAVPVHHLGLYREPTTLEPVEYYNNLSSHAADPEDPSPNSASSLAIILDPIIATGGTSVAAIQTLREWGAQRILVISILGAASGLKHAAEEWPEGTEIWVAGVDEEITSGGMIKPGLGDVGDRLFLTVGK
ncbi:unnamed protein product [Parascedosporium putredinis]|uniref:uracil phosphoribosyltransferase n=1 Tax=Parascedosporium putredinis TaxID=1442378 RepID=A0A9P1MF88_9PEZI|nr:unnamed protein product [Parascedosporium putredinis]CAI8002988.1 unnamed protein product [Parascedosporium putredinis]